MCLCCVEVAASDSSPAGQTSVSLISPVPDTQLTSDAIEFSWQAAGPEVDRWWLWVGSESGASNYHNSGDLGSATTHLVTGLPYRGSSTIHIRLWYKPVASAFWNYIDEQYRVANITGPGITTDSGDFQLTGTSSDLQWSEGGLASVSEWWFYLGSQEGQADYYNSGPLGNVQSVTVNNLPMDGSEVYARLYFKNSNSWRYVDEVFSAGQGPELLFPASGSALGEASQLFSWQSNGIVVEQWWVSIGTIENGIDIFNNSLGLNTSLTIEKLPATGEIIFLKLFYRNSAGWHSQSYQFKSSGPGLTSHDQLQFLTGADTETFVWSAAGTSLEQWWVTIGSQPGWNNYFDSGNLYSAETIAGQNLPNNANHIYLRLYSKANAQSAWNFVDYTFRTGVTEPDTFQTSVRIGQCQFIAQPIGFTGLGPVGVGYDYSASSSTNTVNDGGGFVLRLGFDSNCSVTGDKNFEINITTSANVDSYSEPGNTPTLTRIISGDWDGTWGSELAWSFKLSELGHSAVHTLDVSITESNSGMELGGQLEIRSEVLGTNNSQTTNQLNGIYLDNPAPLAEVRSLWGLGTSDFSGTNAQHSFDLISDLNIDYVVVNKLSHYFIDDLTEQQRNDLWNAAQTYFARMKRIRPDIKLFVALRSWKFPKTFSQEFENYIQRVNDSIYLDGIALDYESTDLSESDVTAFVRGLRSRIDSGKELGCAVHSYDGSRNFAWAPNDAQNGGCDLILPMMYVSQYPSQLGFIDDVTQGWSLTSPARESKLIPVLNTIHKDTNQTLNPPELLSDSMTVALQNGVDGIFVYRPYALDQKQLDVVAATFGHADFDFAIGNSVVTDIADTHLSLSVEINQLNTTTFTGIIPVQFEVISQTGGVETTVWSTDYLHEFPDLSSGVTEASVEIPLEFCSNGCLVRVTADQQTQVSSPGYCLPIAMIEQLECLVALPNQSVHVPESNEQNNQSLIQIVLD